MAYRLPLKPKQVLVTVHVLSVIGWLGSSVCMLLLGIYMLHAQEGAQLYYTLENMNSIFLTVLRIPALITLISGILLSLWTQWGFFKYYWIVIKLVLTIAAFLFSGLILSTWMTELVQSAHQNQLAALQNEAFLNLSYSVIGGSIANIVAMVFMTAISYLKPFGKIRKK